MTQKQNAPTSRKTSESATQTQMQEVDSTRLEIIERNHEPRIDSRLLAKALGKSHKSLFEQIRKYQAELKAFGVLPFQTEKPTSASGGRPERYALLNEDQAFLLLTYSRNTAKVRPLKMNLVRAFGEARRRVQMRQQEYLPTYHQTHEALKGLAPDPQRQRYLHMNTNKLLNKVAGIGAGQRGHAQRSSLALLTVAQMLAAQAVTAAPDDKTAYTRMKQAMQPLEHLTLQLEAA